MSVNVDIDLSGVEPKASRLTKLGQYALANQMYADMNNYVPLLTGDLRNQSAIAPDGKSIYYNVPYARRRFYEPAMRYTTPGTTFRWDMKAKSIHMRSWERVTERAMR